MKSISLTLIAVMGLANPMFLLSQAKLQTFQYSFLGFNYDSYKKTYIKLKPDAKQSQLSYALFLNLESAIEPGEIPAIAFKVEGTIDFSNLDSIREKIFQIDSFIVPNDNVFVIFKLRNIESKEVYFYRYFPNIENRWAFLSSGVSECAFIKKEVDKFTNLITYTSVDREQNAFMAKFISSGKASYFLNLSLLGNSIEIAKKGVWLLFTDGTKFNRPLLDVQLKITPIGEYLYYASIPLSAVDLNLFQTKTIEAYRLYVFDADLNPDSANKIKVEIGCLKRIH